MRDEKEKINVEEEERGKKWKRIKRVCCFPNIFVVVVGWLLIGNKVVVVVVAKVVKCEREKENYCTFLLSQ